MLTGRLERDAATVSLLDTEPGVCPAGHRCEFGPDLGRRRCRRCGYVGLALICPGISPADIERAERHGADDVVVVWARASLAEWR